MPFEKGKTRTGGRNTGTPNKATTELKSRLTTLLDQQFDAIIADFEAMEPKERVAAYTRLLEYVVPKLARTELTGQDGETISVSLNLNKTPASDASH